MRLRVERRHDAGLERATGGGRPSRQARQPGRTRPRLTCPGQQGWPRPSPVHRGRTSPRSDPCGHLARRLVGEAHPARRGRRRGCARPSNSWSCRMSSTLAIAEVFGGRPSWDGSRRLTGSLSRPPCRRRARPARCVVADLAGLPEDLGGVLVGVTDDDEGLVGGHEPAQPGSEHRAQRDSRRIPGTWAAGEVSASGGRRRPRRAGRQSRATSAAVRPGSESPVDECRAASVDLAEGAGSTAERCPGSRAAAVTNASSVPALGAGRWWPAPCRWWRSAPAPGGPSRTSPRRGSATPRRRRRSSASRRSDRYWARASSSVRSGDTRSVRAAEPTISEPPVNTPSVSPAVEQLEGEVLVGVARRGQRPQASARRGRPRPRRPGPGAGTPVRRPREASTRRTVVGRRAEPHRRGSRRADACRRRTRSAGPRRAASARIVRRSRLASTARARPSPRSTR